MSLCWVSWRLWKQTCIKERVKTRSQNWMSFIYRRRSGQVTFSITTSNIMTFIITVRSITIKTNANLSMTTNNIRLFVSYAVSCFGYCYDECHYAECHYAEYLYAEWHLLIAITLNVIMLSVIVLIVIMLIDIMLSVIMLSVNMLRVMAPKKGVFSSVWGPKILRRKKGWHCEWFNLFNKTNICSLTFGSSVCQSRQSLKREINHFSSVFPLPVFCLGWWWFST